MSDQKNYPEVWLLLNCSGWELAKLDRSTRKAKSIDAQKMFKYLRYKNSIFTYFKIFMNESLVSSALFIYFSLNKRLQSYIFLKFFLFYGFSYDSNILISYQFWRMLLDIPKIRSLLKWSKFSDSLQAAIIILISSFLRKSYTSDWEL